MFLKLIIISVLFILCLNGFAGGIHPSYNLIELRPTNFKPLGIGGLDFLPDGRMVISEYGHTNQSDGKLYVLNGVTGEIPNVSVLQIEDSLREPLGVRVVGSDVYVLQDHEITKFSNIEEPVISKTTISTGWKVVNGFNWATGLEHKEGYLHFVLNAWNVTNDAEHGCWMRASISSNNAQGNYECLAGGLRSTNAMALGPEGGLFTTDNQGNWKPSDDIYHLKPNRYYGFNQNTGDLFRNNPVTPGVAYLPHGVVYSLSDLVFVKQGLFAGQMLVGDLSSGKILRVFLERVNGEYQSSVFIFCASELGAVVDGINTAPGEFDAGVNRLRFGPDGDLYLGELGAGKFTAPSGGPGPSGGGGNWTWGGRETGQIGAWTGLQKLRYNGNETFEMLAIRSLPDGFEIEFTQPVGAAAESPASYQLSAWRDSAQVGYGQGHRIDSHTVAIQSVSVSSDRKKVMLNADPSQFTPMDSWPLKASAIHFKLVNLKSQAGEDPWTTEGWYHLNQIGPAEVVGCMDPNSPQYNSMAVYDDGIRCNGLTGTPGKKNMGANFNFNKLGKETYSLHVVGGQIERVQIRNVKGKTVKFIPGNFRSKVVWDAQGLAKGVYLLTVSLPYRTISKSILHY